MNTVIRFNRRGAVNGVPESISSGDTVTFELIGEDVSLSDGNASTLSLRSESYRLINTGLIEIGFGADSVEISSLSLNAYTLQVALNSMDAIRTAGGVEVRSVAGGFEVYFLAVGTRSALTLSHSAAGSLSGRCVTLNAGSASVNATFFLDLSISVIAKTSSVTALSAATATLSTVTTGDASNAQVQKLTVSRAPDAGKMQLDFDGAVTDRFSHADSGYRVKCLLDTIADGDFVVDRNEIGETVEFLITRTDKGASTALTVTDTFTGPVGLSASLDLSTAKVDLVSLGASDHLPCRLEYEYDSQTRFSVPVNLLSDLPSQGVVT